MGISVVVAAATPDLVLLSSTTLSGAAANVDITGIPSYKMLKLVITGRTAKATGNVEALYVNFNGSTSDFLTAFLGSTTYAGSGTRAIGCLPTVNNGADAQGVIVANISNNDGIHKGCEYKLACEDEVSTNRVYGYGMVTWKQDAMITRITLVTAGGNNLQAETEVRLYGYAS